MQITNVNDYTSSNAMRFIDTGKHLIINTVPYTKDTNSPVPFNNISILKYYTTIAGHNAVHPQLNCYGDTGNDYTSVSANYVYVTDKKAVNMIVDSANPDISYVVPSWGFPLSATGLDSKLETGSGTYPSIYKLTTLPDGTIKEEYLYLRTYRTWQGHIYHMTQNNDYVYLLWGDDYSNYTSETIEITKINKKTFQVENTCYINMSNLSTESYKTGISRRGGYDQVYYGKYVVQVLYENESGYILFVSNRCTESGGYSTHYFMTRIMFFNFETCEVADLTTDFGDLASTEKPYGLPTLFNSSSYPGYNQSNSSTTVRAEFHYIPSKYLETDNEIYGYYYAQQYYPTDTYYPALYLMNHSKTDFMSVSFTKIPLVFPEDSVITTLPRNTLKFTYSSSNVGYSSYYDNRYVWETMTTNHNGVDYVHLFYKGTYNNPLTTRGIYTFEISEDRSQATFKSFYQAIDGSLHDYMVLTEDRSKIAFITMSSFHILKFDPISKSWISVHDEPAVVRSMIQTAENKLYYLTMDHAINMIDLNGAILIDFNFEKQSYNYNNVDINSYISIWAKDAEGNYCDTNIKLTITGNAVWQENGIQTLETATSSAGPIEIPFVIKGHTSINVGVDAII